MMNLPIQDGQLHVIDVQKYQIFRKLSMILSQTI